MNTIDAMKRLQEITNDVLRDPQNITRKMLDEMTHLIDEAIAREEAQTAYEAAIKKHKEEGEEYMESLRKYIPVIGVMAQMEEGHCMCHACKDGVIHLSDCSVHNAPALPVGPCDCGIKEAQSVAVPQEPVVWTESRIREVSSIAADKVAKNADVAPQLCFPHIYLTLKKALGQSTPSPSGKRVLMTESEVPEGKTLIDTHTFCTLLEMALKYKESNKINTLSTPNF
ncbi:MAG: hypothetical protein WAV93_11445 [Bacteroidales bacterium]